MDNNLSFDTILTETESSFDRQWRNMEFCYTIMEQHREMEQFVNECLIKASGNKKAINEMYILNEGSAGDKVKGFFTKIKNFFKKIFDKLGASMSGVFMEQKKYMDKYAYIITKCKWQQGDISDIKDRFKGLPRIIDAVDNVETAIIGNNIDKFFKGDKIEKDDGNFIDTNTFTSVQNIETAYNDETKKQKIETGATRDATYEKFINESGYWGRVEDFGSYKETDSNGNVDIAATFSAWFEGSKDTVAWSGDDVEKNFQTIINTTYAGQSYITKLEKIVASVTKKMDEASRNMENYHKAQQDKIMQAVKGNVSAEEEKNIDKAQEEEKKNAEAVDKAEKEGKENASKTGQTRQLEIQSTANTKNAANPDAAEQAKEQDAFDNAAIVYKNNDTYVNEMKFGDNSKSTEGNGTKVAAGTGTTQVNSAGKANEKVTKMQTSKLNANGMKNTEGLNDKNKGDIEKKAQELLDVDIYNRQVKINESINISSTIVNKMFAAFQNTNKDFFQIIKAHVQWYLSNPGAEKDTENQSTNSKNLNMNAGSENVKKAPAATETTEKTEETSQRENKQST